MGSRRTSLYDHHEAAGARFTEFGGWTMPVSFDSITVEHEAVRTTVGRFDVSHMGEIEVTGPDATELMQRLTTNDVTALEVGDAQYSAITDEDGIILDDAIVFHLAGDGPDPRYLFVPNAGNNARMHRRWLSHRDEWTLEASVTDRTAELAMVALQGPEADATLGALTDATLAEVDPFTTVEAPVAGIETVISRTGYTAEDGFELLLDWDDAPALWAALDVQPCGLGARDTLRMEAGFLLGGHEFDRGSNPRTPYEAGIDFAVDLETSFVGRDALAQIHRAGPEERLVGIGMVDRGIPRQGYAILDDGGDEIGEVTSGTQSPTLDRPIGLGYVDADVAEPDTPVAVRIRSEPKRGKVESLPFVG